MSFLYFRSQMALAVRQGQKVHIDKLTANIREALADGKGPVVKYLPESEIVAQEMLDFLDRARISARRIGDTSPPSIEMDLSDLVKAERAWDGNPDADSGCP